ncbi:unnamed protein product [Urochloa decumbens]|uniref:DUF1618 domain-containing protein n=1 Tax=Urochloa decumbens TaxID=240449 RepID=A0ABC9D7E9_9POAL
MQTDGAAASSPCMLLTPYAKWDPDDGVDFFSAADSKTVAAARTADGHLLCVGLRRAPPPALSRICLHFPDDRTKSAFSTVIAAHGDSVLIDVCGSYFVYNTGDPVTLSLLPRPPRLPGTNEDEYRRLNVSGTGILRRGQQAGEFVVAELTMVEPVHDAATPPILKAAVPALRVFRSGEWRRVERPRVVHGCIDWRHWERLVSTWESHAVVPLGGGGGLLMCWVDSYCGVMLCDVFEEVPTLRYLPYPLHYNYLCIGAGGTVKLLDFSGSGCSHHGRAADTWTLKTDGTIWAVDGVADEESTELWALNRGGKGYARVQLVYPVASTNYGGSPWFFKRKRGCCTN